MALHPYSSPTEKAFHWVYLAFCAAVFVFLVSPIVIVAVLSFNAEPYLSFTKGMLALDPEAYSLRWYRELVVSGMLAPEEPLSASWWEDFWTNSRWLLAARNSLFIGLASTVLATSLGTLAALGLARSEMPYRTAVMSLLVSPMITPLVITATGMFFFYSRVGLSQTYLGLIMAHATLGTPFVIITVTATLSGFDRTLVRASASLGANSWQTFRWVTMPQIMPGVISGGLFAFATSLDEVVVILFMADPTQRTIPRLMWSGIREQLSPAILSMAVVLVLVSSLTLLAVELLRRRSERLRTRVGA